MPVSDAYGQGVTWLDNSDSPDLRVMGDGLGNPLVARSNMRFASASQRDATITSPVAGMEAWLADVKLKTLYDGAAWVVQGTGTSLWTTLSLASGYTHNGNSNGTAQYRVVNLFGERAIMLRGGVNVVYTGGQMSNDGNILSSVLPAAARPSTVRTTGAACSVSTSSISSVKLDAQPNGQLRFVGKGGSTPPWVSLNGIFYSL
ncbi:hypothetical protein [Streptomyces harbinensis]|uniref:hypothetical protein n=1 Tax=Streptomyces harbinensis TaxID=1176198 RepID=UPI0036BD7654